MIEGIFTFSADEPDVTFECSLDGGLFTTCEFAFEFAFEETQVGSHTFEVRATDPDGNTDPSPARYEWTVIGVTTVVLPGTTAYVAPEDPAEPATGGETTETNATIVFQTLPDDPDAMYYCTLDDPLGERFAPCTSPVAYTGLLVGEHTFLVFAESEFGSQLEATEYSWEIVPGADLAAPDTQIVVAPDTGTSSSAFEFTGTDDQTPPLALAFECRLDSTDPADWFECATPYNLLTDFPAFAPGSHTFEVRAIDDADPTPNTDPTPAVHTWIAVADTVPPVTELLATPAAQTVDPDVLFTFAATDNATPQEALTFVCSLDGGAAAPCESPVSIQGLDPGVHTFTVSAVDLAGNPDPSPATFVWTLVGAPATTITGSPASPSASQAATFEFTADQAAVTFECALAGTVAVDPTACTSPLTYTGLVDGTYTFSVAATNSAGLVEDPAATITWTVAGAADTMRTGHRRHQRPGRSESRRRCCVHVRVDRRRLVVPLLARRRRLSLRARRRSRSVVSPTGRTLWRSQRSTSAATRTRHPPR